MKRIEPSTAGTVQFSQTVRKLKFFGTMHMATLERVLEGLLLYEFGKGEKVCVQGGPGDSFFVVQQGRLAVTRKAGRFSWPRRVALLAPGDCFGEMALLHQAPRNATVACLAPSRIFVLPAAHFQGVLAENPDFARQIKDLAEQRQFELDLS